MLIPASVVPALLPALSVAVPAAELAPLFVSVTSSGQVAMPDSPSEQVKCTVTGSVPTLPAVSLADPLTTCPAVSAVTVTGLVTDANATPEPASSSLAVNDTVTSLLFQSFAFGTGVSVWLTVGAMLSHFSATADGVSTLPALSTAQ